MSTVQPTSSSSTATPSSTANTTAAKVIASDAQTQQRQKNMKSQFFEASIIVWATILYAVLASSFFDRLLSGFTLFQNNGVRWIVKLVIFALFMYLIYVMTRRETNEIDWSQY
jgi:hypothetical protein